MGPHVGAKLAIFAVLGLLKKDAKFERIFETIFSDSQAPSTGCAKPVWGGFRRVNPPGKAGYGAEASARPGPKGGQIEPPEAVASAGPLC